MIQETDFFGRLNPFVGPRNEWETISAWTMWSGHCIPGIEESTHTTEQHIERMHNIHVRCSCTYATIILNSYNFCLPDSQISFPCRNWNSMVLSSCRWYNIYIFKMLFKFRWLQSSFYSSYGFKKFKTKAFSFNSFIRHCLFATNCSMLLYRKVVLCFLLHSVLYAGGTFWFLWNSDDKGWKCCEYWLMCIWSQRICWWLCFSL